MTSGPEPELDPERLYRLLLESAPDAIVTIDEKSIILSANHAAQRLFGYSAEELVGRHLTSLMPESLRARHNVGMARYLATGERRIPWQGVRVPITTRSGAEVPVEISFGEYVSNGRRVFSGFLRDMSERVAGEAAVKAANAALESQNMQLADQAMEMELANQQLQEQAAELEAAQEDLQERSQRAERAVEALARSRAQLEAQARQLDTIAQNATLGLFIMDDQQRCTYMNPAAERLTGFTLAELQGKALHYHIHHTRPDGTHYPLEECPIDRAFPQRMREQGEEVFVHKDGTFYDVAFTASPIREGERIVGTIIEVRDIRGIKARERERERLMRELEIERGRLRDVFRQAPVAVAVLRGHAPLDLVFELVNPRYMEMIPSGRDPLHRRIGDVLPEAASAIAGPLQQVLDTGKPFFASDHRVPLDRDGDGVPEDYYFNFVYHPLTEADGQVAGIVGVGTEVTDLVNARYAAEHQQRVAEAARQEAEEANRAKTRFLATMSHELRTPLNAIAGHVALVLEGLHGPVTDAQRQALERTQRANRHLLGLINDVLDYARLEAGRVEYAVAAVDVRDVLSDVLSMVEPQIVAKGLALDTELPADGGNGAPVRLWADRDKLAQVLVNLLSNAAKFTPKGGSVRVSMADDPADAERGLISVADTGIGIAPERMDVIFEPFVQLGAGYARTTEGTGLGLAISRDLARGMGGDLTVKSVPGAGSTFTVALRKAKGAEAQAAS